MKRIFYIAICVLALKMSAQEKKTVEIYTYENNVRSITPTQIIEISPKKVEIYQTTEGIKNITPTLIIQNNEVFKVEGGIPEITPIQRLEVQTPNPVLPEPDIFRDDWFVPFD